MLAPTQSKTDTIAITRTLDGVEAAVHRVIEQVGGMQSVLRRAKIATQTEFVAGRSAPTASTTSFALLNAVALAGKTLSLPPLRCYGAGLRGGARTKGGDG